MRFINFVRSADDLIGKLNPDEPVFLDTETDGLYGPVRLIQLYQDKTYIVDVTLLNNQDDFEKLKKYLSEMYIVCYNATYDLTVLGIVPKRFDDIMYMTKMKYPALENYSLDRVVRLLLPQCKLYDGLDKKSMQKKGFGYDDVIDVEQLRYAEADVLALSQLWPKFKDYADDPANVCYRLDMLSMRYALQYQRNGCPVNTDLVNMMITETLQELQRLDENDLLPGVNVNSPAQVTKALGTESSSKQVLLALAADGNEKANYVLTKRRLVKQLGFLQGLSSRVYSIYKVAGCVTGRFSAEGKNIEDGINLQQVPRNLKHIFTSNVPGFKTIEADYSTLELRLAATIFKEENMVKQLKEGKDLHTEVAKALTGKEEITKEDRFRAKAVNFGFVYGMSAGSFREYAFLNYGLSLTDEEAKQWRDTYFTLYPAIGRYHKYVWANYKNPGFLQYTALGRPVKPKRGTDAINAPVQGSGAECTKLAIHYLVKAFPEALKYIVNVVHDSIKLEVPEAEVELWSNRVSEAMCNAWYEMCKTDLFYFKDVPIKVDVEVK